MPRKPRTLMAGEYYHIVTRPAEGGVLFRDDADYARYRSLLADACRRYGVKLYHYSLLPAQVHLVMCCETCERGISRAMGSVQSTYARYFNGRYGGEGPLFEDRYKSVHIRHREFLLECGRYVERAPVRGGCVEDPAAWPWSSCRFYTAGADDELVTVNPAYARMAWHLPRRRQRYERYVSSPRAYEELTSRFLDRVLFSSTVL